MSAAAMTAATGGGIPPFVPAPRVYKGCMGRVVPGLPRYPGDYDTAPGLLFSWLLYRVPLAWQQTALSVFKAAGDEDFLLSWPDFAGDGGTPQAFGVLIQSVRAAGFRPAVMCINKNGPTDLVDIQAFVAPVLPVLRAQGVPRVGAGWELNFLDPGDVTVDPPRAGVFQPYLDWLGPQVRAWGAQFSVHFIPGYGAWQPNGLLFADFWNRNINQLDQLWHQKITAQDDYDYQFAEGGLRDILLHFNGGSGCTPDRGNGTPFDLVAFEVNLELLSAGTITEAEMHRRASVGVATPPTSGPTGTVSVMGSGCGLA